MTRREIDDKACVMGSISHQYGQDMAQAHLRPTPDLTNFHERRKLAAMNFQAVRIALIITIIPEMVG
ncbi:hypothetical protein [Achromobacter piechaudii]|uniref:hypothetical protein n=1 Tax=Achromobacter piechaudii TaxID=72556 RepID=UPI0012E30C4A|nr:hypothetical protein [Achromobacter piechaudii]